MQNCTPTILLLNLLGYLKFLFNEAFTRLGLLKPPSSDPQRDHNDHADHFNGYLLLMDGRTGSLVHVPLQVVTSTIKNNLRVLKYGEFIERFGDDRDDERVDGRRVCIVCLDSMEESEEMRELCNCDHVFHKDCLDNWVNQGRVTCPLCRSTLFPVRFDWTGRARLASSWIMN